MKKILIPYLVILLFLTSSVAFAVESTFGATPSAQVSELPTVHILPDNPLYFLKTLKEKAQLLIARNASSQADLLLDFSQKRLAEALKVAEKGKLHISEKLFEAFGRDIKTAQEKIAAAKASGERTYKLLIKLQETVVYQRSVIEELQEEVSPYSSEVGERVEALNSFLVEIDQDLGATPSAIPLSAPYDKIGRRLGIFDWIKGLFGKKEILSPLAE